MRLVNCASLSRLKSPADYFPECVGGKTVGVCGCLPAAAACVVGTAMTYSSEVSSC